jgi:hypothetical protein
MGVLPPPAEVLGVPVDGIPAGRIGPGRLGDRLPPAGAIGEHPQPVSFQHIGVVHPRGAGAVVGHRRVQWLLAVAMAVALVAQVAGVMAGPVAGWDGEVTVQHRPAGGVLVDQVAAGGVGVAVEVAGDGVKQDAALVGGGLHPPVAPDRPSGSGADRGRVRPGGAGRAGEADGVGGASGGGKPEGNRSVEPDLMGWPAAAFPQLRGVVAGTGFEPV